MIVNAFEDFEIETTVQIDACNKAYGEKDFITIKKQIHTLKGSSGTLGMEKIAQKAKDIEMMIKKKEYSTLGRELQELNDKFVEFKENFTNIIRDY